MKSIKKYTVQFIILALGLFVSCQDMDEIHEEYIKDGEIKYTNKVDSLQAFSGNKRIMISGYISGAFNVNEIEVTWNNGNGTKTFPYSKSGNHTDPLNLYITELEEKSYEFQVYSKDADGNKSIPITLFGSVYGENFMSNLEARGINNSTYDGTDGEIEFAVSGDEFQRDTELKYTNNNNEEIIVTIASDESTAVLANASSSVPVMYRTYYVPTLADEDGNETSIDVFPSEWKSLELILEGSINFGKSDWIITDFSSEEPAEGAPNGLASAAIDDDLSTFWHSDWANQAPGYPHYFAFDMGVEKTITGFEVFRRQGNGNGQTKHKFYVSLDGTNWTDLGEYDMDPTTDAGQTYDVAPVLARYVKYEATEGPNHYAFLAEINVMEHFDNTGWIITDFSSEEPAEGAPNGLASAAIDDDLSTFWHSDWANQAPGYPHYFAFDMGVEKTITGFEVFRRQGNGNGQTKHKFYVSLDGTNWTDLGEYDMDPTIDAGQTYDVAPVLARYVKYEATEGPNHYAFLAEINVNGY